METKPTLKQYEEACAVVKRMQENVLRKYYNHFEGALDQIEMMGLPMVGVEKVRFRLMEPPPWGLNDHRPCFVSPELSIPLAWLDMSTDEIRKEKEERKRVQKEKDLRLNEARLAMVLKAGVKLADMKPQLCHFTKPIPLDDGSHAEGDYLYNKSEEEFMHLSYKNRNEQEQKIWSQWQDLPRAMV